jgi:hypothetical protein
VFDGRDPLSITDPMEWAEELERLLRAKPEAADAGTLVGWFSNFQSALEAGREGALQEAREAVDDAHQTLNPDELGYEAIAGANELMGLIRPRLAALARVGKEGEE